MPGVTFFSLDITDLGQIDNAAAKAVTAGGVDVVFNNAGYGMAGPLEGSSDEQMVRIVNTNLMGPIRTTKAFIPHFRQKRSGLFINTTSIGGVVWGPFQPVFPPTKGGGWGWGGKQAL